MKVLVRPSFQLSIIFSCGFGILSTAVLVSLQITASTHDILHSTMLVEDTQAIITVKSLFYKWPFNVHTNLNKVSGYFFAKFLLDHFLVSLQKLFVEFHYRWMVWLGAWLMPILDYKTISNSFYRSSNQQMTIAFIWLIVNCTFLSGQLKYKVKTNLGNVIDFFLR